LRVVAVVLVKQALVVVRAAIVHLRGLLVVELQQKPSYLLTQHNLIR
jgi:hypothetical protein